MALLCELCQTANRDGAKFCKGCGRKIAQSWPEEPLSVGAEAAALTGATGGVAPAADGYSVPGSRQAWAGPLAAQSKPSRHNGRSMRLIIPLAGVLIFAAVTVWFAMASQDEVEGEAPDVPLVDASAVTVAPPTPVAVPNLVPAPQAAEPLPAPAQPEHAPEVVSEAKPKAKPTRKSVARKPTAAPAPAAPSSAPTEAAPAPAPAPTPQEACAGLNFIAKSRCLASQCAQPQHKAHPQCQAVREQQRLEEEKRNPQLAN